MTRVKVRVVGKGDKAKKEYGIPKWNKEKTEMKYEWKSQEEYEKWREKQGAHSLESEQPEGEKKDS